MILYLDTSGLVKLYVEELFSEFARELVAQSEVVATSCIALPEMASGLARKHREGELPDSRFKTLVAEMESDWVNLGRVGIDEQAAARLAIRHPLRGADAVHLSAALRVCQAGEGRAAGFLAFDRRLNQAAQSEGLRGLAPPEFVG